MYLYIGLVLGIPNETRSNRFIVVGDKYQADLLWRDGMLRGA